MILIIFLFHSVFHIITVTLAKPKLVKNAGETSVIDNDGYGIDTHRCLLPLWNNSSRLSCMYELVREDSDASQMLGGVFSAAKVDDMIFLLKSAMTSAATTANVPQKALFANGGGNRRQSYAATAASCHEAYERMRAACLTRDGGTAWRAERSYKLAVRWVKRGHLKARQAHLADLLKNKPKDFWRIARRTPAAGNTISKEALYEL